MSQALRCLEAAFLEALRALRKSCSACSTGVLLRRSRLGITVLCVPCVCDGRCVRATTARTAGALYRTASLFLPTVSAKQILSKQTNKNLNIRAFLDYMPGRHFIELPPIR